MSFGQSKPSTVVFDGLFDSGNPALPPGTGEFVLVFAMQHYLRAEADIKA